SGSASPDACARNLPETRASSKASCRDLLPALANSSCHGVCCTAAIGYGKRLETGEPMADGVIISNLKAGLRPAPSRAEAYFLDLRRAVAARVAPGGKVDRRKIDEEQRATHGLAWVLTYVETLKETANWADRIAAEGKFGEIEQLLSQILFGEYLSQLI